MLRVFMISFALLISTLAHADTLVSGIVGKDKMKTTHVEPKSIILQDENGQDALVVFYRLEEKRNKQLVGFSIARSVDEHGKLVWDSKDYVLKSDTFSTQGFAPQPVMFNNSLYLFGGRAKDHHHNVLYNSFANLQDLINHTDGKLGKNKAQYLSLKVDKHDTFLSAITINNKILLAYQKQGGDDHSFFYASCDSVSGALQCADTDYTRNGDIYAGNLNLATVDVNGIKESLMFTARNNSKHLNFFLYDANLNDFSHRYTLNGRDGNGTLLIAEKPAGIVQKDNALVVYFKEPKSHVIHKTSLPLSDVYKTTGAHWGSSIKIGSDDQKKFQSDSGLNAINFKDRAYVFYSEKNSKTASYFSE